MNKAPGCLYLYHCYCIRFHRFSISKPPFSGYLSFAQFSLPLLRRVNANIISTEDVDEIDVSPIRLRLSMMSFDSEEDICAPTPRKKFCYSPSGRSYGHFFDHAFFSMVLCHCMAILYTFDVHRIGRIVFFSRFSTEIRHIACCTKTHV